MSKREKTIVTVMILSVLYGAYALFFAKQAKVGDAADSVGDLNVGQFITEISKGMKNGGASDAERYILSNAEKPWGEDPFFNEESILKEKPATPDRADTRLPLFSYSGFISMGNRNLAIIDGQEYGIGESLEPDGFVVKSITPVQVVLSLPDGEPDIVIVLEDIQ